MELKEIDNKEIWEKFLLNFKEKTFLQSWNWGEFQKLEGNEIFRFGIYENNELLNICLVLKIKAKRGAFMFLPHGPVSEKGFDFLAKELKDLSRKKGADFLRIASIFDLSKDDQFSGFKNAPIHMHPEVTLELDLSGSEQDLLSSMRKTTRYLIRQAEKNQDISIVKSQNRDDLKIFNDVYIKTAKRHDFTPFSLKYLENEFDSFIADDQVMIFLGKYKEKVVCSALIIFWQGIAFYHQGASLTEYNKIPVSYLLQWEAIKEAKKRGCYLYNFWGIAPTDKKSHPWHGLSLFKIGFGGKRKNYIKTKDFPLSKKYFLISIFETLRRIKRGL